MAEVLKRCGLQWEIIIREHLNTLYIIVHTNNIKHEMHNIKHEMHSYMAAS